MGKCEGCGKETKVFFGIDGFARCAECQKAKMKALNKESWAWIWQGHGGKGYVAK